jgi:hypothetical protein
MFSTLFSLQIWTPNLVFCFIYMCVCMHITIILNFYYYSILFIFHHIYNRYVCVCLLITNVFVLCKKSTLGMVMGGCCRHLVPLFIPTSRRVCLFFILSSSASPALPLPYFIMRAVAFHLWEQAGALLWF